VLTVNLGIDESRPTHTAEDRGVRPDPARELVASSRAAFGVAFDPSGAPLAGRRARRHDRDDRALLVVMDLVAAETPDGAASPYR